MLVKFKNDSLEFEEKVEHLKGILSVGAASKVAEYCVDNYSSLDARACKLEKKYLRVLEVLEELRRAVRAKESADEQIQILLGEKL